MMSIGPMVRRLLSPAMERKAAGFYRALFVDLGKVAQCLAAHLPGGSKLLDIGGGDGELINRLLDLRPDMTVTMVDIAKSVGKFVDARHGERVTRIPAIRIEEHIAELLHPYDAALVSDVMHHLPASYRGDFLFSVKAALGQGGSIFVKDIEPGHFISGLSLACDKYISGDRGVALISQRELRELANAQLPKHDAREIGLYAIDRPNYILSLDFGAPESPA